jgi:aminoacyl tRNA synthase complex-interacting multifunctional protein 2
MYKLQPYFDRSLQVELPTCMYKLKSYYGSHDISSKGTSCIKDTDPTLRELENRQEAILRRLEQLKSEVNKLAQKSGQLNSSSSKTSSVTLQSSSVLESGLCDIVINADPTSPPLSVLILKELLAQYYRVLTVCHTHSSSPPVSEALGALGVNNGILIDRGQYQLVITLIWRNVNDGPILMVKPHQQTAIHGEANIVRYLARLLHPAYDEIDPAMATEIDTFLDLSCQLKKGNAKEKAAVLRTLNARLGKNEYLVGGSPGLADIVLWSAIHQAKMGQGAPGNVSKWLANCSLHPIFKNAVDVL